MDQARWTSAATRLVSRLPAWSAWSAWSASWRVYKVTFAKPIGQELVIELDFPGLVAKNAKDIESLYLFCKEGWMKSVLGEYHTQKQALSRFCLGAMMLSDPILQVLRRELRRMSPDVRVEVDEIKAVLTNEVLKRDVLEGDKATDARKKVNRASNKQLRAKSEKPKSKADAEDTESVEEIEAAAIES